MQKKGKREEEGEGSFPFFVLLQLRPVLSYKRLKTLDIQRCAFKRQNMCLAFFVVVIVFSVDLIRK